jgi:hypothetical protein
MGYDKRSGTGGAIWRNLMERVDVIDGPAAA